MEPRISCCISLESKWASALSVQNRGSSYEFYLWDEEQSAAKRLFTIYVLTGQNRDEQSGQKDRFVLYKTDAVIYAAALDTGAADYAITKESLIESFHLIQQEWKPGEI